MTAKDQTPGPNATPAHETARPDAQNSQTEEHHPPPTPGIPRATRAPRTLTPPELLQLQRALGNRIVGNLLTHAQRQPDHRTPATPAPHTRQPHAHTRPADTPRRPARDLPITTLGNDPTLQRLTGFEIETFLPIFRPVGDTKGHLAKDRDKDWDGSIGDFLFGGVKYGLVYGSDPDGNFTFSADHNQMQTAHKKLVELLILSGLLREDVPFRTMSILEYITPPRDELAPNADYILEQDIKRTRAHIAYTQNIAASGKVDYIPESTGMLTGLPSKALITWAQAHTKDTRPIEAILAELQTLIQTNHLSIQKTTGVLPEDIPALYDYAVKNMGKSESKIPNIMTEVMGLSVGLAKGVKLPQQAPEAFIKHQNAVFGFLTYLGTHLLVDTLTMTSMLSEASTAKNFFPYMPKVPLSTSFKALPAPLLQANCIKTWSILIDSLIQQSDPYDLKYWQEKYKLGDSKNNAGTETQVFGNKSELKIGQGYIISKDKTKATLLNLISKERPTVQIGIGKNLPGLDEPNQAISGTGQKGIPMEDRYLGSKHKAPVTIDTLDKVLVTEHMEARDRGLKHVGGNDIENVQSAIKAPPEKTAAMQMIVDKKIKDLTGLETWLQKALSELQGNEKLLMIQHKEQQQELLELESMEKQDNKKIISKLEEKIKKVQQKIQEVEKKIDMLKKDIEQLELQDKMINNEILKTYDDATTEPKKLEKKRESMEKDIEKISKQTNKIQDKIYKLEDTRDELESSIDKEVILLKKLTQTAEMKKEAIQGLKQIEEAIDKCKQEQKFYDQQLQHCQKALSYKPKSNDLQDQQEQQKIAHQTYLEIHGKINQKIHHESPFDQQLNMNLVLSSFKKDFGIERQNEQGNIVLKKLTSVQKDVSILTQALKKNLEMQQESLKKLELVTGKDTDAVMGLVFDMMKTNEELIKQIAEAREILKE